MVYETLKDLFIGICDAVRQKDGSVGLIEHQDIPDRILEIKGIDTSGATADAKDIVKGKTAFVNGEEVVGELPVCENAFKFTNDLVSIDRIGKQIIAKVKIGEDYIFRSGSNINFEINNSRFGDADLSDVVAGKTFTSSAGFQKEGEHVCSSVVVEPEVEVDNLSELHYWEKVAEGDYILEENVVDYLLSYSNSSLDIVMYGFTHYADEVAVVDGTLALVNPVARGTIDEETLRGKYIQNGTDFYRVPADVTITTNQSVGATAYLSKEADRVFKLTCVASGTVTFVVSNDSTTFPENGEQDGYFYTYKGTLNDTGSEAVIAALTITENGTYTVPAGVDGYSPITVNVPSESVPAVEQATPSITVSSSGLITASATQEAGQVAAGTKTTTKQLTTQEAQTIIPGTADQTIASERYLTGVQTIKGDANLVPENLPEGITIFGVTGTKQMSSADLSDIGNLHFWEKYGGDPTNAYLEQENVTANLMVSSSIAGTTSTKYIYFGSTFTLDEETKQFSLESEGYCSTLANAQTKLPGKYIRYDTDTDYLYYVPEDAEISEYSTSHVVTARYIKITNTTKLTANGLLGYVASEGSDTYPETGEHSDGYWYVYRGLLADALGQ